MADDIGGRGEDPRDVARRRLKQGIRYRSAQAASRQGSGPSMTPSNQSVVPYQERLPTAPEGGRGGPPAPSGGREVGMPRGENAPAIRREGMPSVRVPSGSAEAMRGAMQSPMARAMGTGRGAVVGRAAEGAMRLSDAARRAYGSYVARVPDTSPDEGPPEPRQTMTPGYEDSMAAGSVAGRQASQPAPRPRQVARPAQREMTADDLNEIVLRLNRGERPETEVEKRLADRMGIAYRKGGMVKPKTTMKKGGKVMKYQEGGPVRVPSKKPGAGGPKSATSAPKSTRMRDMMTEQERKEYDAPLTSAEKERMRTSGFKKGGAIKAPPKKMMKGGMTSKPKAKMAKYAKGGMTRGCK